MQTSKRLTKIDILFKTIFTRVTSCCLMILGRRNTGKTDLSLLIAEILFNLNILTHVASNIHIYSSPFPIQQITNIDDLEFWASNNKGKKLFILDEAGKSLRRRSPMSKLNIKLLDNLQILRKFQLSLIMIAPHEKYIDSATLGSDVLDGTIFKPFYKNQKVALFNDWLEEDQLWLNGIPSTSIKYNTWDVAPFVLHGESVKPVFKTEDLSLLWDWSHGATYKSLNVHPQRLNRIVRKFIKEVMEREVHTSHTQAIEDNISKTDVMNSKK